MKICPVAIAVGCAKCPIFKVCPVKGVIGDYVPPTQKEEKVKKAPSKAASAKKSAAKKK